MQHPFTMHQLNGSSVFFEDGNILAPPVSVLRILQDNTAAWAGQTKVVPGSKIQRIRYLCQYNKTTAYLSAPDDIFSGFFQFFLSG